MTTGDVLVLIERVRRIPRTAAGDARMADMLRQDASHFRGLSTGDVHQLRGHILAALEHRTHSSDAQATIREDIETSLSPVVLAGAARALRNVAPPHDDLRRLLAKGAERISARDEFVAFGPEEDLRTACEEIAATLDRWAEPRACCGARASAASDVEPRMDDPRTPCGAMLDRVVIEDQAAIHRALVALLRERPSIIAFFYTRCMNPQKCSLTVMRLGDAARHLAERPELGDWNMIGVSYDPEYDTPPRLHNYGRDRGFPFGAKVCLARCTTGWPAMKRAFGLRVGYGAATVNEHARECFLVTPGLVAMPLDSMMLAAPADLFDHCLQL